MRISLIAIAAVACTAAAAQPVELLTEENPPLNFTRAGEVTGTGVLVVREMLKRSGVEGRISVQAWNEAFDRARRQKTVCVFSTVRSPDREKFFQWVGPVSQGVYSVFALKDFGGFVGHADRLKDYRVAAVSDARAKFLRDLGVSRIVEGEEDDALPRRLTLDPQRADGADLWLTQAYGAVAKAEAQGVAIKGVFRGAMSRPYWLACNTGMDKPTVKKLDDALWNMRKDGTYQRLADPELL